jgi:uncharacterized membrane-anchored protein YhcB (DUF1043 family)
MVFRPFKHQAPELLMPWQSALMLIAVLLVGIVIGEVLASATRARARNQVLAGFQQELDSVLEHRVEHFLQEHDRLFTRNFAAAQINHAPGTNTRRRSPSA